MTTIPETDLILNADGSIYHLNLLPEDLGEVVITVGDPDRVPQVSKYFDRVELKKGKREFITHTGFLSGKRITVISTGIGTDNIDIVLNELDALVNIDFLTRQAKKDLKSLEIVRIGTSGSIQPDIPINTILISSHSAGLDTIGNYYPATLPEQEQALAAALQDYLHKTPLFKPYFVPADQNLVEKYQSGFYKGITLTAPGFYAPQGRRLRADSPYSNLISILSGFQYGDLRITNLEMETAGIYALANALGHRAVSINAILANRATLEFSKEPLKIVEQAISKVLELI